MEPVKGLESLIAAVKKDCASGNNCFNAEGGCTQQRYRNEPENNPLLIEMGFKEKNVANTKCFHDYCGKLQWIRDRAAQYAQLTGKTVEQVIEAWEKERSYWYMNYYQDYNQPELNVENKNNVVLYDNWVEQAKSKYGTDVKKWRFKCPACNNVQTIQDFIDLNIEHANSRVYSSCIGRYTKEKGCNWSLGGLFKIHKKVVVKDMVVFPVFDFAD